MDNFNKIFNVLLNKLDGFLKINKDDNASDNDDNNDEILNGFNDKIIKRILICSNNYDKETMNLQIRTENNLVSNYILKKIASSGQINVYELNCEIELKSNIINFMIENFNIFGELELNDSFLLDRCIFYEDDQNYNHVHDVCKNDNYLPKENEISYSVYLDSNKSAISFFIN